MKGILDIRALVYSRSMTVPPQLDKDLPVHKVRNRFGEVIELSRYFDEVTYVTNRGRRVAAIVPVDVAEQYELDRAAAAS